MSILVPAKSRKRSYTYWVNGAVVLAGILQIVLDSGRLSADTAAAFGIAIAVVNLVLREFTKQPVGKPGELVEVPAPPPAEPTA